MGLLAVYPTHTQLVGAMQLGWGFAVSKHLQLPPSLPPSWLLIFK